MKITKEHVRRRVYLPRWKVEDGFVTITAVGNRLFLAVGNYGEESFELEDDWELYEEPKKTVKVWPALITNKGGGPKWGITSSVFVSEEEARYYCGFAFVSFPAVQNPDGSYDVPEVPNATV